MRSRKAAVGAFAVAATAAACATVLGVDRDYRERPTAEVADAGLEADSVGPGPSYRCGERSVTSCLDCDSGSFACPLSGACVGDCAVDCEGAPVRCIACGEDRVVARSAVCQAVNAAIGCVAPPLTRCACAAPIDCPGEQQVCADGGCLACGESGSNRLPCKAPADKKCDADDGGKIEDETTCH